MYSIKSNDISGVEYVVVCGLYSVVDWEETPGIRRVAGRLENTKKNKR